MVKIISRPAAQEYQRILEKETIKETSKAIDTDWIGSNVSATNAPANHRIYIMVNTDTVVRLEIDDGTNTNSVHKLNDGTALTANVAYAFDLIVPTGYSYNIQHATTTQNINVWIVESSVLS